MGKSRTAQRRERMIKICSALPEVTVAGKQHLSFTVRKKKFAYYLDDHHGDGRIALNCKALPGENTALVEIDPKRFYMPPYVGPKGWVGLYLDLPGVDWEEVEDLLCDSYRLAAPKTLARRLES